MNSFVFQSNPERFDLRTKIIPNHLDTWYATRYRSEMKPGDVVFFWMAGNDRFRGLYGWGIIESTPYLKEGWESHGVDVQYIVKFSKPIHSKVIRSDATLEDMLIFRAPQATNFLLTEKQTKRLVQLIIEQGEKAPNLKGRDL